MGLKRFFLKFNGEPRAIRTIQAYTTMEKAYTKFSSANGYESEQYYAEVGGVSFPRDTIFGAEYVSGRQGCYDVQIDKATVGYTPLLMGFAVSFEESHALFRKLQVFVVGDDLFQVCFHDATINIRRPISVKVWYGLIPDWTVVMKGQGESEAGYRGKKVEFKMESGEKVPGYSRPVLTGFSVEFIRMKKTMWEMATTMKLWKSPPAYR